MNRSFLSDVRSVVILGIVLIFVYWFVSGPLDSAYLIARLVTAGCLAIAVIGLSIVVGASHQFHLGQAFFCGLGAYWTGYTYGELGWPALVSGATALLVAIVLAYPIGLLLGRLAGLYFAVATLALAIIGTALVFQLDQFTGGEDGRVLPYLSIGSWSTETYLSSYLTVWAVALIAMLIAKRFLGSRRGVMTMAVGIDEAAARSLGIRAARTRMTAFTLAAVFGALGGVMFAFTTGFVYPGDFDLVVSIELVVYSIAGFGGVIGGVVATLVIGLIPVVFTTLSNSFEIILGVALTALMVTDQDSLQSMVRRVIARVSRFNKITGLRKGI